MAVLLSVAAPASAQSRFQTTGPNECLNCHDHEAERTWYEKNEIPEVRKLFPEKGANAGHINALKQLEAAKSNDYAKAIGLKDKYDTKGSCVKCHGTVFSGDANAGVSCESCHGPASGYLKPHQTKGSYDQQVAQFGMTKLVGNLAGWSQQCTSCHVMDDAKLVAAGHPSGDDFDLGKKYGPVALHFKKKYSAAEVSAIGRSQVDALVRKRGGGAAPAAAAAPPAAAPVAAVIPPPAAAPVTTTPSAPPAGRGSAPPPRAATPSAAAPAPPPALVPIAPVMSAPSAAPAAPSEALPALPAVPPAAAVPPGGITSLPAGVALVQGRLIVALTQLLQQGAAAPVHAGTPGATLTPYSGPDAALLQLQREAIALALDALGTAPAPASR
jgi:hypothetical protein